METRNQRLIREILQNKEQPADHSLQKHAWDRAQQAQTPRTMTPWEWEQWYAEHGVPSSHQQVAAPAAKTPWWRRTLSRLFRKEQA